MLYIFSRSASLVVTSVGLPNVQNPTPGHTPDYSVPNSRRGSSQTISGPCLGGLVAQDRRYFMIYYIYIYFYYIYRVSHLKL